MESGFEKRVREAAKKGKSDEKEEGVKVTIHAYGEEKGQAVMLVHPSLVRWDYFEYVIPLMESRYHLLIPALPGYDEESPGDFTSVEEIASSLAEELLARGITELACIYGCSMGASVVARFLADDRIKVRSAVMDGGITPYQLPWLVTRFIALRDFLMIYMGKLGGLKLLEKAFSTDEYSAEDLQYVAEVMKHLSAKTIWRTFDSCNNYLMPKPVITSCERIEYWFAVAEQKERKWDIDYMKKNFPKVAFRMFLDVGHGGLALLKPDLLVSELERVMKS